MESDSHHRGTKQEEEHKQIASNDRFKLHRTQRLIPLTIDIRESMMDFNGPPPSNSSDKPFYNTFSITSLVREEVQGILQELSIADQFIRKEEIDKLIDKCLKEKAANTPDCETDESEDEFEGDLGNELHVSKTTVATESDNNQELEVTVEMVNESDKNKLIVENFQLLEQRITSLEERISTVLQTFPKLQRMHESKVKINTDAIKTELQHFVEKIEKGEAQQASDEREPNNKLLGPYDIMFYEQRQYAMNLLRYKKSKVTMELNKKLKPNLRKKPITITPATNVKPKVKSVFLCANV